MPTQPAVRVLLLRENWRMVRSKPSAAVAPSNVDWTSDSIDANVPGTVASTLIGPHAPTRNTGFDIDDFDWWYNCQFPAPDGEHRTIALQLGGLATIAEVWLNGESVHSSRNMFRTFRIDVSGRLRKNNTLSIAFRSLNYELGARRPRGRWKTNLVSHQQLRWIRTTLLGRIPGWTPPLAAVGPWREISLICGDLLAVTSSDVHATAAGGVGSAHVLIRLDDVDPSLSLDGASISILGDRHALSTDRRGNAITVFGRIDFDDVASWFPHSHGSPVLHEYSITIGTNLGDREIAAGRLGFRSIEVDRTDGQLAFRVNGRKIFARGGCWTSNDIVSLAGDPHKLRRTLELTRQSGANMIRVGGTMVYESDLFYDLCDELGIAVWQDFMFASMDYPSGDDDFLSDARLEIDEQLRRLRQHPCVVAWCGSSEVEQQAAMFGKTGDVWKNDLFYNVIPSLIEELCPGMPYFPSSPCEGSLPFHNSEGPAHYFGVGAYLQPLDDLYKSDVRFASECLAFSNVPSENALRDHFGSMSPPIHHPDWKSGVPRDSAAGWDFEDVRDYYTAKLYGLDPIQLRYADRERYIAVSQVVPGELMERVYGYWRGERSRCNGGLIWFLNDIVPGAGWGLIDSDGYPKPLWYFLRRCWSGVGLSFADRGLNGLDVQIVNETGEEFVGSLQVLLLQYSRIPIAEFRESITVGAGETALFSVDAMLGRFLDTTYRYRFGPSKHEVVLASLHAEGGGNPKTACFYPGTHDIRPLEHAEISVECTVDSDTARIRLRSDCFLKHVRLFSQSHGFDDNFFDLPPDTDFDVEASPIRESKRPFRGVLSALNLAHPVAFK